LLQDREEQAVIVIGTFAVIVLGLVAGTVALVHLGFRGGDDRELHRRIDDAANCRWQELGRLSRLP
jgi:hypothetical protein